MDIEKMQPILIGGRHAPGEESGLAPGANLMNIKVLGDDGTGTVEAAILGIEHVIELVEDARRRGLSYDVNMSWGTEDDGDPDNPLRVVLKRAAQAPLGLYAAAGNSGPNPGTIMLPASMPEVWAVGAVTLSPFGTIWNFSSRGPTRDGLAKPDLAFFGVDVLTASAAGDESFEIKSGTSFSCPAITGGATILMQVLNAYGLIPHEQLYARIEPSQFLPILVLMSKKPQGASLGKDNDYGVGIPFGDLILRTVSSATSPLSGVLEMMVPLMGVSMVAGIAGKV
jgi:serine protease AprX